MTVHKAQLMALVNVTAVIMSFTALSKNRTANINKQNRLQKTLGREPSQGTDTQTHLCEAGSFFVLFCFCTAQIKSDIFRLVKSVSERVGRLPVFCLPTYLSFTLLHARISAEVSSPLNDSIS